MARTVIEELVVVVTGDTKGYQAAAAKVEQITKAINIQLQRGFRRITRSIASPFVTMASQIGVGMNRISNVITASMVSIATRVRAAAASVRASFMSMMSPHMRVRLSNFMSFPGRLRAGLISGFFGSPLLNRFGQQTSPIGMAGRMGARIGAFGALASRPLMSAARWMNLQGPIGVARRGLNQFGSSFVRGINYARTGSTFSPYNNNPFGVRPIQRTYAATLGHLAGRGTFYTPPVLQAGGAMMRGFGGRMMGGGAGMVRSSIGGMIGSVQSLGQKIPGIFSSSFAMAMRPVARFASFFHASMRRIGHDLDFLGRRLTFFVSVPLAFLGIGAVKRFAEFDDAITTAQALMGDMSPGTKNAMAANATNISNRSITAPQDLANTYKTLASAGYDAQGAMAAMVPIERLSVAGLMDMGDAATNLIGIQAALGQKTNDAAQNMKSMTAIGDVLVKANQLSQASVEDFAEALSNKGGAALRLFNKDITEGVAVLAAYATQNVTGASAGEKLWAIIRDMQRAVLKNSKAWSRLGVDVYDAAGKMRGIPDIIGDMEDKFNGMSDQQKRAALMALGLQDRSLAATLQLMGLSHTMKAFQTQLELAGGSMDEMANNRLTSFASQMKILRNNLLNVSIEIGRLLVPALTEMNRQVQKAIDYWNSLSTPVKRVSVYIALAMTVLGPFVLLLGVLGVAFARLTSMVSGTVLILSTPFTTVLYALLGLTTGLGRILLNVLATALSLVIGLMGTLAGIVTSVLGGLISLGGVLMSVAGFVLQLVLYLGPLGALFVGIGAAVFAASAALVAFVAAGFAIAGMLGFTVGFVGSAVKDIVSGVKSLWTSAVEAMKGLASGAITSFQDLVGYLFNTISTVGPNILRYIKDFALATAGFIQHFQDNFSKLSAWLTANWSEVWFQMSEIIGTIWSYISINSMEAFRVLTEAANISLTWIGEKFVDTFNRVFLQALLEGIVKATDYIDEFAKLMWEMLTNPYSAGFNAGKALTEWKVKIANEVGHLAGKQQGSIGERLSGINPQFVSFNSLIESIKGNLTEMLKDFPELNTKLDLSAFEDSITKLTEVGKSLIPNLDAPLQEARDKIEEPLTVNFGVTGVESVISGTTEAMNKFDEAMNKLRKADLIENGVTDLKSIPLSNMAARRAATVAGRQRRADRAHGVPDVIAQDEAIIRGAAGVRPPEIPFEPGSIEDLLKSIDGHMFELVNQGEEGPSVSVSSSELETFDT